MIASFDYCVIGEETELDLRIRKIKEKNEAILKRKREVEADKQRYAR